jgi:aerobic-type carbon monoxide dehydrogenase small subunit (CoxS/CutS family)
MPPKKRPDSKPRSSQDPEKVCVRIRVNGKEQKVFVEPRRTLLDVLRKDLGLTGTKKGCDEGTCGACTVLADGKAIYACMVLALDCAGRSIETIEALEDKGRLHPIQQAFIEADAFQCGFCTPGQVMSAKALLEADPNPDAEKIRRTMAGNICRCGAYPKIFQAVARAAQRRAGGG